MNTVLECVATLKGAIAELESGPADARAWGRLATQLREAATYTEKCMFARLGPPKANHKLTVVRPKKLVATGAHVNGEPLEYVTVNGERRSFPFEIDADMVITGPEGSALDVKES